MLSRFFTKWIWLAILTFTVAIDADLIIATNNQSQIQMNSVEVIFKLSSNTKLTEELVLEATTDINNVTGKIYVLNYSSKADTVILKAQQNGALAVLKKTTLTEAGFQRYQYSDKDAVSQINIHVFEVAYDAGKVLTGMMDKDEIETITIIPDEGANPWEVVFTSPGYYIWSAILFAFSAANIGLAIWKLRAFIKYYGGFQASVALFILIIETISNILRIASMVDPFGAYGVYDEYASISMLNVSFPFGISAYLLLILYWHEMMTSSSVVVHKFISSMKIPFYVIVAALLGQNLVMKLINRFVYISNYFLIITIVYLVIVVALTGLYMSIGIKILKRLHSSKQMGRRVRRLRTTTIRLLMSVMFFFILVCIGVLFVVKIAYTAVGFFACWFALFTVLNAASMMNILAFQVPTGTSGTSRQRSRSVSTASRSRPQSITNEEKKVIERQFKAPTQPQEENDSESEESDTSAESEVEDNTTRLEATNNSENNVNIV